MHTFNKIVFEYIQLTLTDTYTLAGSLGGRGALCCLGSGSGVRAVGGSAGVQAAGGRGCTSLCPCTECRTKGLQPFRPGAPVRNHLSGCSNAAM